MGISTKKATSSARYEVKISLLNSWPSSTSEFRFLGTKLTIDSYSFDSSTPPPNSEHAIYCGENGATDPKTSYTRK